MNRHSLSFGLNTKRLAKTILYYDKIDSTNKKAKSLAKEAPLKEGTTLVASQQTEGKGTDGNQWQSHKGNLYLSVIFPFDERITTLFPLYPAVALCQVLRKEYMINAHVKWPNDVLVGTKKIAGILCEGISGQHMIMGIGINVFQKKFEGEVKNIATSISLETKQVFKIEQVFQHFMESYEKMFYNNCNIREEWLNQSYMIGKKIHLNQDGHQKTATVTGLSPEGFLEICNEDGKTETWMARRSLDISAQY